MFPMKHHFRQYSTQEAGINNSSLFFFFMQPLPTPVSSNTLTQSACMPSGLNHSSYLVPCSAQLLYCYYGCCTAARQIHNMFVKEANGGVMFPAGMKQTCIQRQIHTTCAINTPPGSGVTDTTTTTHTHTHTPPPTPPCLKHTHSHMQLSWGTCQSSDSALQGFMVDH